MNSVDLNCVYEQEYNIIICHHKEGLEFAKKHFSDVSNKLYLSDTGVEGTIDVSNGYPSNLYGELPFYSWVAQNLRPKDWARIHHYRRRLPISIGLTLPSPLIFNGSISQQMAYYHSPILVEAMLKTMTPIERQIFTTNNNMFCYNMMFAPVEFIQTTYLPWMMDKINALQMVLGRGFKPDASFFEPREGKRIDEWYQNRIYAFAMERYTTIFFLTNNFGHQYRNVNLLEPNQSI